MTTAAEAAAVSARATARAMPETSGGGNREKGYSGIQPGGKGFDKRHGGVAEFRPKVFASK